MLKKIILATTVASIALVGAQAADKDVVEEVVFGWGEFNAGRTHGLCRGRTNRFICIYLFRNYCLRIC